MVRDGDPRDPGNQGPGPIGPAAPVAPAAPVVDAEEEFRGLIPIALDYSPRKFGRHIQEAFTWSMEPGRRLKTLGTLVALTVASVAPNWEISHKTNVGAISRLGETYMINQTSRLGSDTFYICEPTKIAGVENCEPFERDLGDAIASLLYRNGDDVLKGELVRLGDFCEDAVLDGYATTTNKSGVPTYSRSKPFDCDYQYQAKKAGLEIPYTPKPAAPVAPTSPG